MNNFSLTYFKSDKLIYFIVITTLLIMSLRDYIKIPFRIGTIFTTIILTLYFISNYLWGNKYFKWILELIFWIEDISGTYEGTLQYKYISSSGEEITGKLKHTKVIIQNGYRIIINSYTYKEDGQTKSSKSENIGMFAKKEDNGILKIYYNYLNQGSQEQNFPPHYGTEILEIINTNETKELSGVYFTNRIPQTKGEFKLKLTSKKTDILF